MKHLILEKFKSKILSDLFNNWVKNSTWKESIERSIYKAFDLKLDQITDDMITKISGKTLKNFKFDANNKLCFWINTEKRSGADRNFPLTDVLLAVSQEKKFIETIGTYSRAYGHVTFKSIKEVSNLAYIIDFEKAKSLGGIQDLIQKRLQSKEGALALKKAEEIKKENKKRYDTLIKEKRFKENKTDKKMKEIVKKLESFNDDYIKHPETWEKFSPRIYLGNNRETTIWIIWREVLEAYETYILFYTDFLKRGEYKDSTYRHMLLINDFHKNILSAKKLEMTPEILKQMTI